MIALQRQLCRLIFAASLFATAIVPIAAASPQAASGATAQQTARPQKPVTPRDSLWTLRTAQNRLQVLNYRVSEWAERESHRLKAAFRCEKEVLPFCYGPNNGNLLYGLEEGYGLPLLFRTAPGYVDKRLEKTLAGFVRYTMNELEKAYKKIPGDRWLVGQRIYHTVDHGELERAQQMARDCVSDRWWCASLVGFTSYLLDQMDRADSAFSIALESMPDDKRCRWEDVSDLLYEDSGRKSYLDLPCRARKEVNRTFWWLSDPLYLTPGNERMAAHYFREIFRQLFRTSIEAMPPVLKSTMYPPLPKNPRAQPEPPRAYVYEAELWLQGAVPSIIRNVGVPMNVVQEMRDPNDVYAPLRILLMYEQPTYSFIPDYSAVAQPLSARAAAWDLENPRSVERFHPKYGVFRTLDYQIAFFRRGDSARVIAATDITRDSILVRAGPQLLNPALVMSKGPGDIRISRDTVPGTSVTFDSMILPDSMLFSIEALASGIGAGRVRFASGPTRMPPQRVSMSDVMLIRSSGSLPTSLGEAVRLASPTTTVSAGSLDLFWEVYGLETGDSLSFSLTATDASSGVFTRLGRVLGVVSQEQGASVRWTDVITAGTPVAGRAITLDISNLARGTHRLSLEIAVRGQQPVSVRREITVRR